MNFPFIFSSIPAVTEYGIYIFLHHEYRDYAYNIAIKPRKLSDKVEVIPSKTYGRVGWPLSNNYFTDNDGYVQIVITSIPSYFHRMWPTVLDLSPVLYDHKQQGRSNISFERGLINHVLHKKIPVPRHLLSIRLMYLRFWFCLRTSVLNFHRSSVFLLFNFLMEIVIASIKFLVLHFVVCFCCFFRISFLQWHSQFVPNDEFDIYRHSFLTLFDGR